MLDQRVRGVGRLEPGELARSEAASAVPVGAQRQGGGAAALLLDPFDEVGAAGEPAGAQQTQLDQREETDAGQPRRQ
jgi:hypothetical protein